MGSEGEQFENVMCKVKHFLPDKYTLGTEAV